MASIAKFDTWQDSNSRAFYGARAWVNFNGTGVVAIKASSGVSSITDGGVGSYVVNFTTAMPDTNYAPLGFTKWSGGPYLVGWNSFTTSGLGVSSGIPGGSGADVESTSFAFFR